jgi:hypothetical protein
MKIGEKINFIDLIKHTLHDSFEFSAHTPSNNFQGQYILNGVGMNFAVGFDENNILNKLKQQGVNNIIFLHTHPLINDDSLNFVKGKSDPRKLIALGMKLLPLGNPPTKGDIEYFQGLKLKYKDAGILIKGVVLSARGIWLFDTKQEIKLREEKLKIKGDWGNSVGYLLLKEEYPSYFMELEVPQNMTKIRYKYQIYKNPVLQFWIKVKDFIFCLLLKSKIRVIIKNFSEQGVILEFISYKSIGISPINLMKETIKKWEEKSL